MEVGIIWAFLDHLGILVGVKNPVDRQNLTEVKMTTMGSEVVDKKQ